MDRSAFKATPIEATQEQEAEQKARQPYGSDDTTYHKYDEGDNYFRIYPAHPNCKSFKSFSSKVFVKVKVTEKDGNGVESTKIKSKPIFNSIYHSDIMKVHRNGQMVSVDLINEYINFIKTTFKANVSEDEFKRVWRLAAGSGQGDDVGQLKSNDEWMVYADKYIGSSKTFGLLGLKKSVAAGMNTISAEMAASTGIDPFTDPDTGIRLIVNKNEARGKSGGDWYECKLEKQMVDQFNQRFIPTPLSDADLEFFAAQTSLCELYTNSYRVEDFLYGLEGLQRFDAENNVSIFQMQEWNDIVQELMLLAEKLPKRADQQSSNAPAKQAMPAPTAAPQAAAPIAPIQQGQQQPSVQQVVAPVSTGQVPQQSVASQAVATELLAKSPERIQAEAEAEADLPFNKPEVAEGPNGYPANWDAPATQGQTQGATEQPMDIAAKMAEMKSKLGQ